MTQTEKKIEELKAFCERCQTVNEKCVYPADCHIHIGIEMMEQGIKDGETRERERIGNKLYGIIAQGGTYESQIEKIKKFVYELLAKIRGDDSPTTTGRIQ